MGSVIEDHLQNPFLAGPAAYTSNAMAPSSSVHQSRAAFPTMKPTLYRSNSCISLPTPPGSADSNFGDDHDSGESSVAGGKMDIEGSRGEMSLRGPKRMRLKNNRLFGFKIDEDEDDHTQREGECGYGKGGKLTCSSRGLFHPSLGGQQPKPPPKVRRLRKDVDRIRLDNDTSPTRSRVAPLVLGTAMDPSVSRLRAQNERDRPSMDSPNNVFTQRTGAGTRKRARREMDDSEEIDYGREVVYVFRGKRIGGVQIPQESLPGESPVYNPKPRFLFPQPPSSPPSSRQQVKATCPPAPLTHDDDDFFGPL